MANGQNVETLECPDLNAFVAASPGAVIHWLSELPVLVFSKGGQLLIAQAIAGLTSTVSGFALRGGTPMVAPWLFLDRYSEVPPSLAVRFFVCYSPLIPRDFGSPRTGGWHPCFCSSA
jgi:hypothetical protein